MYVIFYNCFGWNFYDIFYFYLSFNLFGFGGLMIYKFVISFLVLNIIFEFIEIIFPIKKMKNMVRSFVLIVMLYAVSEYIFALF